MISVTLLVTVLGSITSITFAAPAPASSYATNHINARNLNQSIIHQAATNYSFPDPGLFHLNDAKDAWWAYSTSSSLGLVPMIKSTDFKTWSKPTNVLSSVGSWATGAVWAPDVRQVADTEFVMYYTAPRKGGPSNDHCIGVATANSAAGPFQPQSKPLICDLENGGAIDASGFQAPAPGLNGTRYILWKVDGNSIGKSTPIKIQEVGDNGYDLKGKPLTLITNDSSDGGLTEAPSLVYWDGWYYLFYSTHNYNTLGYDIKYAVSKTLNAPFKKVGSFLSSGQLKTAGPGGATAINVADKYVNMVFHSDTNGKDAQGGREMWSINNLCLSNGIAKTC